MTKILRRRIVTEKEKIKTVVTAINGKIPTNQLIPTGSVRLNLACSDNPYGGYGLGKIVNLIGDSSSGKTVLALSMLAEVSKLKRFNNYRLIFDDAEEALEFDLEYLFGKVMAERIENDIISNTIEEWYGNVLRTLRKADPFIYVLDSFDSLTSEAEMQRSEKFEKTKTELATEKKKNKGKKEKGSYKTEKPKMASEILRVIDGKVAKSKSLILVISQTRDNIGFGAIFQPKTRSGGKALKFYSAHEIWLAVGPGIKSKGEIIGNEVMAKISKNKLTGKKRSIQFPVYEDYGADDLGSCIDFLVEEKYWKKTKETIKASELGLEGTKRKLIFTIEEDEREKELFDVMGKAWNIREESLRLNRKRKYA